MSETVTSGAADAVAAANTVAWHDLECGGYEADLDLWLELAAAEGDPVLEIGAGTGRVTLALARAGHEVVALDRDPALLAELVRRAHGLPVQTVCADARELAIGRRFALVIVPMQTLQLIHGTDERARFLSRAREHLGGGGLLAAALLCEDFEQFEVSAGAGPDPERMRRDGVRYVSQATALRIEPGAIVIERVRERRARGERANVTHDVVRLDRLTADRLASEAAPLGFSVEAPRGVPATTEHVGSEVAMLRA